MGARRCHRRKCPHRVGEWTFTSFSCFPRTSRCGSENPRRPWPRTSLRPPDFVWCVFPHRRIRSRRLRRIRWPARGDRSRPDVQSGRHRGQQRPHGRPPPVPTAHELHPLGAQQPFLTHGPCRSCPGHPFCRVPRWHQRHNDRSAGCWPGRYRAVAVRRELRHCVHRCASTGNSGRPDRRVDDGCRRRHNNAGHQCRRGCPVGTRPGTRNRSSSSGRHARTTRRRPDRSREFRDVLGRLHRGSCSRHGRRTCLRPCVESDAHQWQLSGCVARVSDAVGFDCFMGCSFLILLMPALAPLRRGAGAQLRRQEN